MSFYYETSLTDADAMSVSSSYRVAAAAAEGDHGRSSFKPSLLCGAEVADLQVPGGTGPGDVRHLQGQEEVKYLDPVRQHVVHLQVGVNYPGALQLGER